MVHKVTQYSVGILSLFLTMCGAEVGDEPTPAAHWICYSYPSGNASPVKELNRCGLTEAEASEWEKTLGVGACYPCEDPL